MGESLIVRRGSEGSSAKQVLKTEIIEESGTFVVPEAINQSFSVRIFGGGGAGNYSGKSNYSTTIYGGAGGGGGFMNNNIFNLNKGEQIYIYIGNGGNLNSPNGESTSFGTYLSATGGNGANGCNGGNGSSGGGGGSETLQRLYGYAGGNGTQFGGGGGCITTRRTGNGGTWGGGGGCYGYFSATAGGGDYNNITKGGTHGGNGGMLGSPAQNGTNTRLINGIDFYGNGAAGSPNSIVECNNSTYRGMSNYKSKKPENANYIIAGGGGGGYGGDGGNSIGGGGGYGGRGGDGNQYMFLYNNGNTSFGVFAGGGGGGYGGRGGDGKLYVGSYTNTKYATNVPSGYSAGVGGGGGAYGRGGDAFQDGHRGGGGGGGASHNNILYNPGNGGNGICIIQYYVFE